MINAHIQRPAGHELKLNLELAFTPWPRLKGLLGKRQLTAAHGLWLAPCNSVHCLFMRFAIDVLYLDKQQRIMAITEHLKPWRMSLYWPAHSVIELAAGEAQRLGIQIGDIVQCEQHP